MKIACNWLKDYVDVKLSPEKLAEVFMMAGMPAESIEKIAGDHVLELEVTANRPDWLSVIGVARELAALTGKTLKAPVIKKRSPQPIAHSPQKIKVNVEDKALCPRYTARVIRNVKIGESPVWLKKKLETMGLRSINNVVDITNFCLFETGEPMHAFDLDTIQGGEVIIRKARTGEKILVIEGGEKILSGSDLVISDSSKPIAVAGVMGGLNTEVTQATKNILLEAAFFDPISVRRTAKRLAIATEASYRFERKVDISNIEYASDKAASLILKLAGGEPCEFIDIGTKTAKEKAIDLRFERLNKVLGVEVPGSKAKKILTSLGLKIKTSSKGKARFTPPAFRYDLNDEIDLIEEVARVYGYDKIPVTLPNIVEESARLSLDMVVSGEIRSFLTSQGADEIITYSLLSKKLIEASGLSGASLVEIRNPLTSEQEVMRPSLVTGMLNAILWNINRKTKDLKLFELGNAYLMDSAKFIEKKYLSVGIAGQTFSSWASGAREANFFEVKGMVEGLLSELGVTKASFKFVKNDSFSPSECASIEIGGQNVGLAGQVSAKVLKNFDIKDKVYIAELDISAILKYVRLGKRFSGLPKYPSVYRDISIVASKDILNSDIASLVKTTAGEILKEIKLIDQYSGKQIPGGKVGLTYRLEYRDPRKTLEEKEVSDVHERILSELGAKLGVNLR